MIAHLDYIKDLGYNAIWVSPAVAQPDGNTYDYHGYAAADLYTMNTHFGSD